MLLARHDDLAESSEPLARSRIGQGLDDRRMSLATTSFGVPFGAHTAFQTEVVKSGRPASANRRFSVAADACCPSRSALLDLRCRTEASTPATSTGLSEVVKMKPGA